MKKIVLGLFVLVMAICIFAIPVSANEEISVLLNGEMLEFDVQPTVISNRVMVPMRTIFESLGATVQWEGNTQKITAKTANTTVEMQLNNNTMLVDGQSIALDVAPQAINGRTLVPVRAVAESFDIHVIWDDIFNSVILSTYIPFETPIQTFDYLCNWLIENGEAFSNYVYIGWEVIDGVEVEIRCHPDAVNGRSCISFCLNTFELDYGLTYVNLWPTYDKTDVYASYLNGTETSTIDGEINMAMHTDNYPIQYGGYELGEGDTVLGLIEDTRQRINLLLDEVDILLSLENTGVNLNTLGFKKH